ncbi:MAG: TlpA family protein disulfide reductase [Firmicutes bacterium]|nr:TlpA family protein disulfide reductase [Bacillota bacterium]
MRRSRMKGKGSSALAMTGVLLLVLLLMVAGTGCSKSQESDVADEGEFRGLQSFEAITLEGDSYTQDDLQEKEATLINFWSLTCRPCIAEMPEIAEFAKSLPDRVEVITVCLDGSTDTEKTQAILQEAGFTGTTLIKGNGDLGTLCMNIQYTPTTVVVDGAGNIVGKPIVGGQENLKEAYTKAINEALTSTGKAEL